jgi:hypothetical protein
MTLISHVLNYIKPTACAHVVRLCPALPALQTKHKHKKTAGTSSAS